ncbi:hypothetical protein DS67_04700 [Mesotoga sp. SC_4PWA21]|nr:hypothetical protein DS67_04700 [Mesotoga sp. SC_4PWA21]
MLNLFQHLDLKNLPSLPVPDHGPVLELGKSLRSEARGRKSEEILIFLPLASFLLPLIRLIPSP